MQREFLKKVAKQYPREILEPYDVLMDEFGFDTLCSVVDYLGGATVYIPNKRTIFKGCLEQEALKEFANGRSTQYLTQKYGFSDRHIRRIVKGS